MPKHMVAYYGSGLTSGSLQQMTPVPDPTVTINGGLIYVPSKWTKVVRAYILDKDTTVTQAQLQTPSLRNLWYPDISPISIGQQVTLPKQYANWKESPLELVQSEGMSVWLNNSSGTNVSQAVVILSDDKVTPTSGKIYTIGATTSVTPVVNQWVNSQLTFNQTLPAGDYDIVGWRCTSTYCSAVRLVFSGPSAVSRDGILCNATPGAQNQPDFTKGANGVYGTFNFYTPPTIDHLGFTATADSLYHEFDLIKRS